MPSNVIIDSGACEPFHERESTGATRQRCATPGRRPDRRAIRRSHCSGAVQGDDPTGQIPVPDVRPSGPCDELGQPVLVGPGADGLRQVDVGVGVGGGAVGDLRQRTHEVLEVDGAKRGPGGRRELADQQRAAGSGHAGHLAQASRRVGDVAQPERDRGGVERVVPERQAHAVARDEELGGVAAPALTQHSEGEVGAQHGGALIDEGATAGPGAGGQVEDGGPRQRLQGVGDGTAP